LIIIYLPCQKEIKQHHLGNLVLFTKDKLNKMKYNKIYYIVPYSIFFNTDYTGKKIAILFYQSFNRKKKLINGEILTYIKNIG